MTKLQNDTLKMYRCNVWSKVERRSPVYRCQYQGRQEGELVLEHFVDLQIICNVIFTNPVAGKFLLFSASVLCCHF